ncbi:hypothetical protein GTR04_5656 [Trichophyton interdigitale]|nr:hypothetical protein GTR04_5656 [Trichophyton interdigitale]
MLDASSSDASFSSDEETPSNDQISQKAKPSLTIVNEELEELERKSKEGFHILEKLETILNKYPSSTRACETLRKQILQAMDQGKNRPLVTIGVVGATGAGKSSLINALLGEECLVPTSGMRACTASITEISYGNGPWEYEAEIQFVSQSSWQEEMSLLLEDMQDGLHEHPSAYDSDFGIAYSKFKAVYQLPLQDTQTISIEEIMENRHVAAVLGSTKYISGNHTLEFYQELRNKLKLIDFLGTGAFQKINDTIADGVAESKDDMFQQTVNTIETELKELTKTLVELVSFDIEGVFNDMNNDYLTGLKNSSEMEKPLKKELLSFLNSTSLFRDLKVTEKISEGRKEPIDTTLESEPVEVITTDGPYVTLATPDK